jgi:hypothetical protein
MSRLGSGLNSTWELTHQLFATVRRALEGSDGVDKVCQFQIIALAFIVYISVQLGC